LILVDSSFGNNWMSTYFASQIWQKPIVWNRNREPSKTGYMCKSSLWGTESILDAGSRRNVL